MKHIKHTVILLGLLSSAILVLCQPGISARAISNGLSVCVKSILPTLFPFFVISDLWCSMGYSQQVSRFLAPFMNKLFHLPGTTAPILITAAVGGYPVGAQTLVTLYQNEMISKQDAEASLLFCNLAGPAFILGVVGIGLFQSLQIGVVLWSIHLISALFLGFLFRQDFTSPANNPQQASPDTAFLPALTSAIRKSGETIIQVCTFILFFSILTESIAENLPTTLLSTVLLGSFELATGCTKLGQLGLSQEIAFVICAGLLGWGGLCVHFQTVSILYHADLSPRNHWAGKALHCLLSAALACLIAPYLPLQAPCFAQNNPPPIEAMVLLVCLMILMVVKSSSSKIARYRI